MDYIQTGWIEVNASFDTFWESRGKNLRTNLRKQRTKLAGEGVTVSFDCITRADDVVMAMTEFARLESAGWKADQGTAVSSDSAQGRFYAEMMAAFCAAGKGEIWQLRFGDKVVAVDLCIEADSVLVILKTAYDPEYRTVSPSSLLKQDALKKVFDDGRIKRVEFYGRLMEWHTRWTDNARTLFHVNAFRWDWVRKLNETRRRHSSSEARHTAAEQKA